MRGKLAHSEPAKRVARHPRDERSLLRVAFLRFLEDLLHVLPVGHDLVVDDGYLLVVELLEVRLHEELVVPVAHAPALAPGNLNLRRVTGRYHSPPF